MKVWEEGGTERRAPGIVRGQHVGQHSLDLGLKRGETWMGRGSYTGRSQEVGLCLEWAFTFWRDHLVNNSVNNESEGDQSGVCSLCVLGWFRTQCQKMEAETTHSDPVQLSCQGFRSQASPFIRWPVGGHRHESSTHSLCSRYCISHFVYFPFNPHNSPGMEVGLFPFQGLKN